LSRAKRRRPVGGRQSEAKVQTRGWKNLWEVCFNWVANQKCAICDIGRTKTKKKETGRNRSIQWGLRAKDRLNELTPEGLEKRGLSHCNGKKEQGKTQATANSNKNRGGKR